MMINIPEIIISVIQEQFTYFIIMSLVAFGFQSGMS